MLPSTRSFALLLALPWLAGCALTLDSEVYKEGAANYVNKEAVEDYVDQQDHLLLQYARAAGLSVKAEELLDKPDDAKVLRDLQAAAAAAVANADAKVTSAAEARAIWLAAEAKKEVSQAVKNDLQTVWRNEAAVALAAVKQAATATEALMTAYDAQPGVRWLSIYDGGINAINNACDSYMNDLFAMHRYLMGGQEGVGVLSVGSAALLSAFDASAKAIVSVAAAFGIATGFFDVVYNSLLFQLDPAIVKSIVTEMRDAVRKKYAQPGNLPLTKNATVYALREYMDKCVPATIEAEITRAIKEQRYERNDSTTPKEKTEALMKEIISAASEAKEPATPETPPPAVAGTTVPFTPERLRTYGPE